MVYDYSINGRKIGRGHPTYIIAEMSANHGHDFNMAVKIVEAAAEAGADAIKLQTYTPDTITINCDNEHFRIGGGTIWEGRNLYDLYAEAYTPWEWQPKLKKIANELGMDCFSSPFDTTAVDFLQEMNVAAFKVASFENVDLPLIRYIAKTGKPVIMSTGMANLGEINEAVMTAREAGCTQLALLKCTSAYPALPEDMNVATIPHLAQAFDLPVGLSDHTMGATVPIASVALGACIIEKHMTLSRDIPGPDSSFSMEPDEFKAMVEAVRMTENAIGTVQYRTTKKEKASRVFRRSLFVVRNMQAGELFTHENVRSIRPGYGLHTRYLKDVIGRKSLQAIPAGTPLAWDIIN